jgi:hypothetical protein
MYTHNGETDRRLNDGLEHSFDSSVRVGVGRRLRRTGPLTVYSFAIGRAHSDRPTLSLTDGGSNPAKLYLLHKTFKNPKTLKFIEEI